MRTHSLFPGVVVLALVACETPSAPGARPSLSAPSGPAARVDYVTEDSLSTLGYSASSGGLTTSISSTFNTDWDAFSSIATIYFTVANYVSIGDTASLILHNGSTLASDYQYVHDDRAIPVGSGDTTLTASVRTLGRTCGLTGKGVMAGEAGTRVLPLGGGSWVWAWHQTVNTSASNLPQPTCPAPKASEEMTYGQQHGASITVPLPVGLVASVGLSGLGSTITDGSSGSYSWTANTHALPGAGTSSIDANVGETWSVSLALAQDDGQTASAAGTLSVIELDCPGAQQLDGSCVDDTGTTIDQVGGGGNTGEPDAYSVGYITYCDVTDWYQWSGGVKYYLGTDVDYCWSERVS